MSRAGGSIRILEMLRWGLGKKRLGATALGLWPSALPLAPVPANPCLTPWRSLSPCTQALGLAVQPSCLLGLPAIVSLPDLLQSPLGLASALQPLRCSLITSVHPKFPSCSLTSPSVFLLKRPQFQDQTLVLHCLLTQGDCQGAIPCPSR